MIGSLALAATGTDGADVISIAQKIQTLICQVAASASEWSSVHSLLIGSLALAATGADEADVRSIAQKLQTLICRVAASASEW